MHYRSTIIAVGSVLLIMSPSLLAYDVPTGLPILSDDGCQTACGPIACFVASRWMGANVSLSTTIKQCGWQPGQLTTIERMHRTITETSGLTSIPAKLSPRQLEAYLTSGYYVAILAVRKKSDSIDHAICAVAVDHNKIVTIDYPEMRQLYTIDQLADIWDGHVLLVSQPFYLRFIYNVGRLTLPVLALCFLATEFGFRRTSPDSVTINTGR
jgi:hypothetical protein